MRWADTDSDDSDDEFQTHGNVVNTSLMVDLDVSAFCMLRCFGWCQFSVNLSPLSIMHVLLYHVASIIICSYILIHAFSAFISWPYVVSSSNQTIHPVLYPTPTQLFSPTQYPSVCLCNSYHTTSLCSGVVFYYAYWDISPWIFILSINEPQTYIIR